ncbi:MAG TPA: xanthine dehydrogenase family protein molybdopterin-binding subunit [Verrucomicrobiae bacterium]|jgi:xanthine dehydrogenase YagR molybdenum-binding subunit|nr:xanthine dehydrogenase family protein molybdopterin-binding subunit [Verrucomicrobiae bacterium]
MAEWPKERKFISGNTKRVDAAPKVTGQARYSSDIQANGWLYGMILRSKWPAAKILSVNLDKALKVPGIKAAVPARDGQFTVRYYGEEIAAVAGTTRQACMDALRAIEVKAEPSRDFVVHEDDGLKHDSPQVWDGHPNAASPRVHERGSVDSAFSECAAVIEGSYTSPVQLHNPMETHGNTVSWTDEGVTVWASTQGIGSVQDGFAGALGLDHSKVRVITDYMGGGFGSKFGAGVEGVLAAQLSRQAKAPVRLMLTRFDEALAVGNRPSSFQKIKMGATSDGKLHAFQLENYGTAGIGAGGDSGGGGGGANIPAPYLYKVTNSRSAQTSVNLNAGSSRAFRAPGNPPASYGMECAMDDLAVKLGMDPLEFRLINDPIEIRRNEYKVGAAAIGWKQKYQKPGSSPGIVKTGIGCAGANWPGGRGNRDTQGEAQIYPDGSIEIRIGVQDIGTGTKTVIAVVAAEMLGLKPEQITVKVGDTNYPPGPGSGGSTTCPSVSPVVYDVCANALQQLQSKSGLADARGANWFTACKSLGVTSLKVPGQWREGLASGPAYGVQFTEVDVDTETGLVTVKKIVAVHDCGLIVNRLTLESQINGGCIIGMGYALYEERVMDRVSGVVLNPNFETYKLTGIADIPEIQAILINMPERGVIGIGEPATVPTAGAIANAVANAIGVRVPNLPITPAKVLAALGKVPPATA